MGLFSKWVESLDYEYDILPTCTRSISPRSKCEVCINSCDQDAILLEKGKTVIDREKCTECGICIAACPVQAIAGIYPKRTVMQSQLIIKNGDVPTVKELLILYKKGIKTIISEEASLLDECQDVIEEANELLQIVQEEPFSTNIKRVKEEEFLSRRELFAFWRNEGKSVVQQVAPAKWRFNQTDFHLPKYYQNFQFATITIESEKCSLCHACEKLCPYECFHIGDEQFLIIAQKCSSCQLCADACPEAAIKVEETVVERKDLSLPIMKKTCHSCQSPFNTLSESDETCPACVKRQSFFKM